MKYLITGGAGFIGSHLSDALIARGDSIVILDNLSTGNHHNIESLIGNDSVTFYSGSILDEVLVEKLVNQAAFRQRPLQAAAFGGQTF